MTRAAVNDRLDDYIQTVALRSIDELDPSRVMDVDLPADAIKEAMREDIREEMIVIKSCFRDQCDFMAQYAAVDDDEAAFDDLMQQFYRCDVFLSDFDGDEGRREAFRDELREYFVEGSRALAPLVASEHDDFWACAVDAYDEEEALDALFCVFERGPIVQQYTDDLTITMSLETGLPIEEVEYTEEAVRVFVEAEAYLRDVIRDEAETAYAE